MKMHISYVQVKKSMVRVDLILIINQRHHLAE